MSKYKYLIDGISPLRDDYSLSEEDCHLLSAFRSTISIRKTQAAYVSAVLKSCDYYHLSPSLISRDQWVCYVNKVIPSLHRQGEITISTSRVRYFAIRSFLIFYAGIRSDLADVCDQLVNPSKPPEPNVRSFPSAVQMASILQVALTSDFRCFLAFTLAYECVLTSNEILTLKASSLLSFDDGTFGLSISGKNPRKISISSEIARHIDGLLLTGGYFEDNMLFHDSNGGILSQRSLQRYTIKVQNPLISSGILSEPFTLESMRSAGIHRLMTSDNVTPDETARLAGVTLMYASSIHRNKKDGLVSLPTKRGFTTSDLLSYGNTSASENSSE